MVDYKKAIKYNNRQLANDYLNVRHMTHMTVQWQQHDGDLAVDGMFGPKTRASVERAFLSVDAPEAGLISVDELTAWWGPLGQGGANRPYSRSAVYAVFGDPGTKHADQDWVNHNIVEVDDMPGVPSRYFQINHRIEPYAREAFRRAQIVSSYTIDRAACFVFRHKQHDPDLALSYHSWGIAIDIDPVKNLAQRFARGAAPEPWSDAWRSVWPDGVDENFVRAFRSCGFVWGADWDEDGDTRDHTLIDPMHFQWVG